MSFTRTASLMLTAMGCLACMSSSSAAAPATTSGQAPYSPEAAAEPNITGVWERYPHPLEEPGVDELSPPGEGPDLREPYASQWKAQRAKRQAALDAGTPLMDNSTRCLPEGMPMMMVAIYPIELLQTPGQITVLAELFTQTRRIYFDRPIPPKDELAPSYNGFSSAHWEGDTLIVKTRGIRENVQFFEIPHSDDMRITERIRLTAQDRLENQIVIDDPEYLNKPYRFTFGYRRNDDYLIMEYICDHRLDVLNEDGTVTLRVEENTP